MKTYNILYQCTAYYSVDVEAESEEEARNILMAQTPSDQIGEERQVDQEFEGILDVLEVKDESPEEV
jgi:hypothetical protein